LSLIYESQDYCLIRCFFPAGKTPALHDVHNHISQQFKKQKQHQCRLLCPMTACKNYRKVHRNYTSARYLMLDARGGLTSKIEHSTFNVQCSTFSTFRCFIYSEICAISGLIFFLRTPERPVPVESTFAAFTCVKDFFNQPHRFLLLPAPAP
jgi:hypothetical protein